MWNCEIAFLTMFASLCFLSGVCVWQPDVKSSELEVITLRALSLIASSVELITFEILAAERLRLMGFDNRLIIDCFANVVNILIWLFSTNDRLRSAKYESNYLENPFPEIKGVNLLSKTHRNDKSNLRPMTVLQE